MKKKIVSIVLAILVLFSFSGCGKKASDYTEMEHIERIAERVERRYFSENSGYSFTDYEINPVYDENDQLKYAVVDFAPSGFVFIKIRTDIAFYMKSDRLYTRNVGEERPWSRYILKSDKETVFQENNLIYETGEDGEVIKYYQSPYKISQIRDEKYYLLYVDQPGYHSYIPAVKRDNLYLNLVSMTEIEYEKQSETLRYAALYLYFINQSSQTL